MSAIDAAIIKALVEHIGMDPDSVPTNQSGSHGTPIPVEWKVMDASGRKALVFTIPEGKQLNDYLPPGTRLFLNNNQTIGEGTREGPADSFIIKYDTDGMGHCQGFQGGSSITDDTGILPINDNEYYITITVKESDDIPLPDNKTTGFFIPNSTDAIFTAIRALLTHIRVEIKKVNAGLEEVKEKLLTE